MNNFNQYNQTYTINSTRASESTLISRVAYLLSTALLVTALSARYADSIGLGPQWFLPLTIGTLGCVFALSFARTKPMLGLFLLYTLSVLEGLWMGPFLGAIARGYPLGATIIGEASGLSALIVAGCGTYVWISNKDFGGLGRFLFWGLIALIGFGFLRFFVHFAAGAGLLYAVVGAALFVGFTLYDFSNIKRRYGPNDYVIATVQLYLDFLNLFLFLVQILMMLSGGGGSSRRN
jgi:FtsH-binding integral membrane protein